MKHILITGSTDGIGKLLALRLAKEGHFIAIHGRSKAKLNATLTELKKESNSDNIIGFLADFSDLDAVKKMALEINNTLPKLDVIVNNAGVLMTKADATANEIDIRLVVNYLAPYQLTTSLLSLLKKSNTPRIVNLSSAAQSPISLKALQGKMNLGANEAYAQSKLALTMWSFNLAKKEPSITVVAVNPGSLLNTKMANEAYGQHWSPAEKGVDILYDLSITDMAKTESYFDNDKGDYSKAHPDAYNEAKIEELIKISNNIVL
ncbi:NAD(P)-dependent dehydrogenase (short-subunit alcohol dehydrogenase family) [Cellulophaga sp. RHA19]|uniref:SDR family NAD(P)-dependent oxidoreductase n=1 Tax=Cellulophaga sp. RHA19 TaxID=1798237 RepID=UPI000C2CA6AE|nr:SDR family NAD(P)-dependent oxidoreductase [Cellulophaga sp. RHA19]PKB44403.1 NAD(P)-dependent dehydrogenase (short-subunit alcohol dehydrogenase family) [Cellulophaga sp. RHA19]